MTKNEPSCTPDEISIKSFFLGPQAENSVWLEDAVVGILRSWFEWRRQLNPSDGKVVSDADSRLPEFRRQQELTRGVVQEVLARFENEIPKFSPRYMGHMFSEVSMPAILGHWVTLLHNPNNISPESSRVGTQIEKEAVELLANRVGWTQASGHFTSGGTIANFEFLVRARDRIRCWRQAGAVNGEKGEQEEFMASHRGWSSFAAVRERFTQSEWDAGILECQKSGRAGVPPVLLVPASKHYSWPKGMHVMGMGEENLRAIGLDRFGRVSLSSLMLELERALKERRPILGVVGVVGTTELGSVDPIQEMKFELDFLRKREGVEVWFHLDAAYGGFLSHLPEFPSLAGADSITLDPHKLGYVPYSSGAFLCQDEKNYRLYSSTGPYIVSDRNTLGNYTLEGSRSATGAVATFVSMKAFQSVQGYEKLLRRTIVSKRVFEERLRDLGLEIWIPQGLDTNILCFAASGGLKKLSQVNSLTLKVYEGLKGSDQYWVSKTTLLKKSYAELIREGCRELAVEMDEDELHLIRLTLMNPFTISKESAVDHLSGFCALLQNILKQSSISS